MAFEKGHKKGFKQNQSGNPNGRPKKTPYDSPLRSLQSKLKNLEPEAYKYLSSIVKDELPKVKTEEGEEHPLIKESINKERMNICKWVIDSIVTVRKAVVADEAALRDAGAKGDDGDEVEDVQPTPAQVKKRFKVYDFDEITEEVNGEADEPTV
jgi:hypothetical protein